MDQLQEIVNEIRKAPGLERKANIGNIVADLFAGYNWKEYKHNYGNDAGVIPSGDEYLLLSIDSIMADLVENDPYFAGRAAVVACVNDIYSTGGEPLAIVDTINCADQTKSKEIVRGLKDASVVFNVPIVGRHYSPDIGSPSLAVAILGKAKKILSNNLAKQGDDIIIAFDLDGKMSAKAIPIWNTNYNKDQDTLLKRLRIIKQIAEQDLAVCCRDIGNAGLLGTIAIMMEGSSLGAEIYLDKLILPQDVELKTWLLSVHSYGFVFTIEPKFNAQVINMVNATTAKAINIGKVINEPKIWLNQYSNQEVLFDFKKDKIIGIN